MALTEVDKKKIEEQEKYRVQIAASMQTNGNQKNGAAAVLSFLVPGLGQVIKGQVGKGIIIFFITMCGYAFLVIPGIVIHIWQIVDAYNN